MSCVQADGEDIGLPPSWPDAVAARDATMAAASHAATRILHWLSRLTLLASDAGDHSALVGER